MTTAIPGRPRVIVALSAYAIVLALVYAAIALFMLTLAIEQPPPGQEINRALTIARCLLALFGVVLSLAFGAVPFLPRRPWVWVYGLAAIALGFTSVVTIPFSIGLLIFWIRPEVKRYYQPEEPPRVEYTPIGPER